MKFVILEYNELDKFGKLNYNEFVKFHYNEKGDVV